MPTVLGVEFAPLNIPLERRLQTLAVVHYVSVFMFIPLVCVVISVYLLFTPAWWLMALYGIWFMYDWDTPRKGGRPVKWFRQSAMWRHFRDYFPVRLVKTADLDPSKNYIFGYHPHGVFSIGAFTNFATEATHFREKFPGLEVHMLTLSGQFWFPFRREYTMMTGALEVSRDSIEYMFHRFPKGHAVLIVLGGAAEALDAHPGAFSLTLKRRKGFCRLALQHG